MSQRLRYAELVPEGMAAMRAVEHWCNTGSGLEPVLLELVRLRVSMINECEYCVGMHSHELSKHNETAGRIGDVGRWRESDAYTQRERAALAWAESVTEVQAGHVADAVYARVREHFSDVETVGLTIAIGSINAWNRLAIAFRAEHTPKHDEGTKDGGSALQGAGKAAEQTKAADGGERDAVGDDGGKVAVDE